VPDTAAIELAEQLRAVHLPPFYHSERSPAASLSRLLSSRADRLAAFQAVDWEKATLWLKAKTSADLAPEQAAAARLALAQKDAVLTGGPGSLGRDPVGWYGSGDVIDGLDLRGAERDRLGPQVLVQVRERGSARDWQRLQ
jgi:hypothetical protein